MMDHMARSFEGKQGGLSQNFVQAPGLTPEINQPISCPRHDQIGILSSPYRSARAAADGVIETVSTALALS
jgi:hypothetical protein